MRMTFEAVKNREDVPYLHEHPFSLETIKGELNERVFTLD